MRYILLAVLMTVIVAGCQPKVLEDPHLGEATKKGLEMPLPPPEFKVYKVRMDPGRPVRPHGDPYEGPIIDTHAHLLYHRSHSHGPAVLEEILRTAERKGVVRQIFLPTPNEGRYPNREINPNLRRQILKIGGKRAGLLCGSEYLTVWMERVFHRGYSEADLEKRLSRLERGLESGDCLGVGEIGPYHFEKKPGMAVIEFPMNFTPFLKMAGLTAEKGVWLDLHAEPVTPGGRSYEDEVFGGVALLYHLYPNLKLILSHSAMTNSRNARALLETYPNLMMNFKIVLPGRRLDWCNLGPLTNDKAELFEDWAALMEAMPGRFMVGTDFRWGQKPSKKYRKEIRRVRRLLGSLDRAAAPKIAHENAQRVFGR